jgi:PHD/YefM family antitoxin component YafN of YafNO toxin-antitoxin module
MLRILFDENLNQRIGRGLRRGVFLDLAQRGPVTIYKKGRSVAVILSMQDFEAHKAMKLKVLQQATDEGLASGLSARSIDELIAGAEREAATDDPAGQA